VIRRLFWWLGGLAVGLVWGNVLPYPIVLALAAAAMVFMLILSSHPALTPEAKDEV
jgi:hypothetical protein